MGKSNGNGVGGANFHTVLVAAIRKIRQQKQRPNVERITNAVRLHHVSVTEQTIEEQLEIAVSNGHVVKVFNKGLYTYRDPAAVSKLQTRKLDVSANTDIVKIVVRTLKELGDAGGADPKTICHHIEHSYKVAGTKSKDLMSCVKVACEEGVKMGCLTENGKMYNIMPQAAKTVFTKKPKVIKEMRTEERMFLVDMADKEKKTAKAISLCSFCMKTSEMNKEGIPEAMISCADCGNSGHPSCLSFSPQLVDRVTKMRWQCIECKKCSLCGETGKEVRTPVG